MSRRQILRGFFACAKTMGLRLRDLRGSTLRQAMDGAARHVGRHATIMDVGAYVNLSWIDPRTVTL